MIQTNVAGLSAYCVRACKIKHLTEREFSGIFSLAGGEFCVFKTEIPGGPAPESARPASRHLPAVLGGAG